MNVHRSIEVSCRGVTKSVSHFNRSTTVADVIYALLDELDEREHVNVHECCLYVEQQPHLLALKATDFIEDVLARYAPVKVQFRLALKRNRPSRDLMEQKRMLSVSNPFERLRIQELLIQQQQQIIHQLSKTADQSRLVRRSSLRVLIELFRVTCPPVRQSRQDAFDRAEPTRSSSRVRFRLSTVQREQPVSSSPVSSSTAEVKSILKKSPKERSSSVDRDIEQLLSVKPGENSLCAFDDDESTTDSCLGSLGSEDGVYHCGSLETLV